MNRLFARAQKLIKEFKYKDYLSGGFNPYDKKKATNGLSFIDSHTI